MTERAIQTGDVPRIDAMHSMGMTQRAIAKHLGIHWRTVHNILCRKGAYREDKK